MLYLPLLSQIIWNLFELDHAASLPASTGAGWRLLGRVVGSLAEAIFVLCPLTWRCTSRPCFPHSQAHGSDCIFQPGDPIEEPVIVLHPMNCRWWFDISLVSILLAIDAEKITPGYMNPNLYSPSQRSVFRDIQVLTGLIYCVTNLPSPFCRSRSPWPLEQA